VFYLIVSNPCVYKKSVGEIRCKLKRMADITVEEVNKMEVPDCHTAGVIAVPSASPDRLPVDRATGWRHGFGSLPV
jgi:hypothetical protein